MRNLDFKQFFVYVLGLFLFFLGVFAFLFAFYDGRPEQAIWLCYIALIFIGLGFLRKNKIFILAQLNIVIIPLIIWNIDFFYVLFRGSSLWGITDYFFAWDFGISSFITLQHVYTVPLVLLGLFFLMRMQKTHKKIWKKSLHFSWVQMLFIFLASRILTSPENNMNCVYTDCFGFGLQGFPYIILWFFIVFVGLYLTNVVLRKFFEKIV